MFALIFLHQTLFFSIMTFTKMSFQSSCLSNVTSSRWMMSPFIAYGLYVSCQQGKMAILGPDLLEQPGLRNLTEAVLTAGVQTIHCISSFEIFHSYWSGPDITLRVNLKRNLNFWMWGCMNSDPASSVNRVNNETCKTLALALLCQPNISPSCVA